MVNQTMFEYIVGPLSKLVNLSFLIIYCFSKIIEEILHSQFEANSLLNPSQSGFRLGLDTTKAVK